MPRRSLVVMVMFVLCPSLASPLMASESRSDALRGERAAPPAAPVAATLPALTTARDARAGRIMVHDGQVYHEADGLWYDSDGQAWRPMTAKVTAYVPRAEECDDDPGITATGTDALRLRGIAADPRAIPYHSVVRVPGYGDASVDDTGGAMRQAWEERHLVQLDVRIPLRGADGRWRSEQQCVRLAREHGVRTETVLVRVAR